jgi:hypothetical protein
MAADTVVVMAADTVAVVLVAVGTAAVTAEKLSQSPHTAEHGGLCGNKPQRPGVFDPPVDSAPSPRLSPSGYLE